MQNKILVIAGLILLSGCTVVPGVVSDTATLGANVVHNATHDVVGTAGTVVDVVTPPPPPLQMYQRY